MTTLDELGGQGGNHALGAAVGKGGKVSKGRGGLSDAHGSLQLEPKL